MGRCMGVVHGLLIGGEGVGIMLGLWGGLCAFKGKQGFGVQFQNDFLFFKGVC